jgi:hypothetical protein
MRYRENKAKGKITCLSFNISKEGVSKEIVFTLVKAIYQPFMK